MPTCGVVIARAESGRTARGADDTVDAVMSGVMPDEHVDDLTREERPNVDYGAVCQRCRRTWWGPVAADYWQSPPRLVEANHLPPVPEQRAHRADRCDGHLAATMTTCAVDGDEKGRASHAVDRQGAGHWTLLQPSLFAEDRPSREGGVVARWWEEDGIDREPCGDDNALPCAAVPNGEQDERC